MNISWTELLFQLHCVVNCVLSDSCVSMRKFYPCVQSTFWQMTNFSQNRKSTFLRNWNPREE